MRFVLHCVSVAILCLMGVLVLPHSTWAGATLILLAAGAGWLAVPSLAQPPKFSRKILTLALLLAAGIFSVAFNIALYFDQSRAGATWFAKGGPLALLWALITLSALSLPMKSKPKS